MRQVIHCRQYPQRPAQRMQEGVNYSVLSKGSRGDGAGVTGTRSTTVIIVLSLSRANPTEGAIGSLGFGDVAL